MRHPTLSFAQAQEYLDAEAEKLPEEMFAHLNGGIILSPRTLRSSHGDGLYTMGEYNVDPYGLGRYITIYYGSFVRVSGGEAPELQQQALREVLHHELTHHVESLANVRDLEDLDEWQLEQFRAEDMAREKSEHGTGSVSPKKMAAASAAQSATHTPTKKEGWLKRLLRKK